MGPTKVTKKSKSSAHPFAGALNVAYAQWLRENPPDKPFEKWLQETFYKWQVEGKGKSFETWLREKAQRKISVETFAEKQLSLQDVLRKVCDALISNGFSVEVCENYIFAKRNCEGRLPLSLFISVQKKESPLVCRYAESKIAMICHITKFRERLSSLKYWFFYRNRNPIDQLDTDVLTSFGWHAYLNENVRRECLLNAMSVLGETRVANVLLWLKNTWPNNPIMPEEYSFNVAQDYDWVRSNFEENIHYYRLKNELLHTLQYECQRLIRERRIKLFEDSKAIEYFLLIIY